MNVTPVAASAVEASLRIDVSNACCCGETERCLALRKVHEFGATTHPMPKVYEQFVVFADALKMPEDRPGAAVPRRTRDQRYKEQFEAHVRCRKPLRFAHIHIHRDDRAFTGGGNPKVASGRTNFRHDLHRGAAFGSPPIPSRTLGPGTGVELGVEASPSKHGDPQAAAIARSVTKQRMKSPAPASSGRKAAARKAAQPESGAAAADAPEVVAEDQRREKRIDAADFPAGSALATMGCVVNLIHDVEAHAKRCGGTLSFQPARCQFVGVVMSLGARCSTCGCCYRWYSSPRLEERSGATAAAPTESFYLNELVPFAFLTTAGVTEQQCCLLEALELKVPCLKIDIITRSPRYT
eukprot:COSAG01_NODE_4828_length_4710_cov_15.372587_7_plen_353_part_00